MRTLSLIVAEDDPFMREWLLTVLQALEARVRPVASGRDLASLLASDGQVDLVISDIRMPGPSGLDALALARAGGSEVPFLLITGYGSSDVLAAASELGAAVLQKPFSRRDLLARVNALCRSRPADDEPAARLAQVSDERK